ncbi:MAG: NfeD family protein [Nodosilinea sp.]
MTSFSPAQPEPDDFPLEPGPIEQVPWGQDQDDDQIQIFEGTWSDYTAEVADVLRPGLRYQVKYEGTYWTAVPVEPGVDLQPGALVVVLGRKGNELMIRPLPSPQPSNPEHLPMP